METLSTFFGWTSTELALELDSESLELSLDSLPDEETDTFFRVAGAADDDTSFSSVSGFPRRSITGSGSFCFTAATIILQYMN